jgi:hypothetical protein
MRLLQDQQDMMGEVGVAQPEELGAQVAAMQQEVRVGGGGWVGWVGVMVCLCCWGLSVGAASAPVCFSVSLYCLVGVGVCTHTLPLLSPFSPHPTPLTHPFPSPDLFTALSQP